MKREFIIIVYPCRSNRTFTLRKKWKDGVSATYKTIQLSKDEFNACLNYTTSDWQKYLLTSKNYSRAK